MTVTWLWSATFQLSGSDERVRLLAFPSHQVEEQRLLRDNSTIQYASANTPAAVLSVFTVQGKTRMLLLKVSEILS